jgi:mono/diheme cytochrome c family protein
MCVPQSANRQEKRMKNMLVVTPGMVAMILGAAALAGPREDLLAQYAAAAKTTGFSAARGQVLHTQNFSGGKPDTPSCTTCHGKDTRGAGRAPTGKAIEPVAVSVTPTRYTDPAKVEKWFKRNCIEVMGRECTPQEKGDWLAFVMGQ